MSDENKGRKLNWRQACAIMGCGKNCFYSLVRNGNLPAFRINGKKRGLWVWENDVKSLVEAVKKNICAK